MTTHHAESAAGSAMTRAINVTIVREEIPKHAMARRPEPEAQTFDGRGIRESSRRKIL